MRAPPHMDRILSWNVRGLNDPNKQEDIKIFLHHQKAGLVGPLETKVALPNIAQAVSKVCGNWQCIMQLRRKEGEL